jgi:hypothetical protein
VFFAVLLYTAVLLFTLVEQIAVLGIVAGEQIGLIRMLLLPLRATQVPLGARRRFRVLLAGQVRVPRHDLPFALAHNHRTDAPGFGDTGSSQKNETEPKHSGLRTSHRFPLSRRGSHPRKAQSGVATPIVQLARNPERRPARRLGFGLNAHENNLHQGSTDVTPSRGER